MASDQTAIGSFPSVALAGIEKAAASGDAAARAYAELAALLGEIEASYYDPERRNMQTAQQRAAGRYLVANALQHAFQVWFPCDPQRPVFHRWLSPTKKLLGDNPDAVYYGAVVDPSRTYRIRGNVHAACYTSFSVETGAMEGHLSKGVISTLNDTEFEVAADGSYEIIASPDPQPKNWLRIEPDAGSITTRHYWEWERSPAARSHDARSALDRAGRRPRSGAADGRRGDCRGSEAGRQLPCAV